MIRNIIFDWSGTLVDDLPAVWEASNHVFTQAGVEPMTLESFRAEFALPFKGFYDRYTPHVPMEKLEEWFHGFFRENQHSVVALPHAHEFLLFCRANKIRTFLLSTVHRDHYEVQCALTGFSAFIDVPYVGVWDKREKILDILRENSLVPGETMFIGDMQHDIDTAHHGKVHSCAVLTGYNRLDQLRQSNPDLIVEHLGELKEILTRSRFEITSESANSLPRMPISTVGALIYNGFNEVLMIRTHKWSDKWGIPGGKIKLGETAVAALEREIKEETNLDVSDIRFVLVQDCIHSSEFYKDAHFILLNYTCRAVGETKVILNREAQEFRWLPVDAASLLDLNKPTKFLLQSLPHPRTHG
ncbi:MAG: Nucleoside triphosphatase NudI [Verrucomicrobiales bacterium]|nr:Nucleoside triphosphatase NudI [Verrucomicrobiales bacterium]